MVLSVIIVNYRVPYFLELCLHSVRKTLQGLDAEIIVVDNHSADGSVDLLRPRFPDVKWIVNTENVGFARANNLAFLQSAGDHLLFLNPDTILPEDFAPKCLRFTQSLDNPGGIGVRMIDGDGRFLKESRRGFPSPWVAFCKLSGLTALFPRSRRFAQYYLGYLPADHAHPAPVLSGACLWVSRAALSRSGPFDETFFMYAEDIDLSFRLQKAGFVNYYFPDTTIIHFKGESTPKDIRYIRHFYKAMIQFRRKHFRLTLDPLIWFRAVLSAVATAVPTTIKTGQTSAKPRRTWLTGDPAAIQRLLPALTASRVRTPAPDEQHAGEIIYCIGKEFSFKSAIRALEEKSPAQTAAFYAIDGLAVISSSRRDDLGETWVL
ncbi:MAG TPA: glycosyltransferase family 2 protein [Puia sp.]|jgi:GT2 family glycosyltransferase|nr:glycosyltransferase family 2 protein [Puia sp.]